MRKKIALLITKFLAYLQFRIDTTRYFFDKPKLDYQPLPWLGIREASIRGEATVKRWEAIKKSVDLTGKNLKDIGSCYGFFCLAASDEFGIATLGVDIDEKFIRIARYAADKKFAGKCNFINLDVNAKTADFLPKTNITICFSVWHHWVYYHGLEQATEILKKLWSTTAEVLFFESGEEEIKDEFKMPFPNGVPARDWLKKYLETNLGDCSVESIGQFEAGSYKSYKINDVKRTVFKVTRK